MADKRSPGSSFQVPAAETWNNMVDAGENYGLRHALGAQSSEASRIIDPNRLTVRNDSGGDILAGRALEVGTKILTILTRTGLWFEGDLPAPDGKKIWGVCEFPIKQDAYGSLLICGAAMARVTVNDADHQFCDVSSGSTTLVSGWHGAKIIDKPAGTGTGDSAIMLGPMYYGPFDCVITQSGGIAGGSSGTADVKWNGSTVDSITVYNDWMDGSQTVGETAEARFRWQPDRQKYVLVGADCT